MVCSVISAAQIDLASFGAVHQQYLAGGANSFVLFAKKIVKSNWFSLVPHPHSINSGQVAWNSKCRWVLGRQGDYLVSSWLRVEIGEVIGSTTIYSGGPTGLYMRWCHNLAHNLIDEICLSFTGTPGAKFDAVFLDHHSAFSVPGGKRSAYDNMIGNIPELVNPVYDVSGATAAQRLPACVLNLPLPMPYAKDLGIALPTSSLIYNEVEVEIQFKNWSELLVVSNPTTATVSSVVAHTSRNATSSDITAAPTISAQLWGTYAVVSSDERKRMAKVARDMIWENVQTNNPQSILSGATDVEVALRYGHAVKALFFAIRNKTVTNDLSNYTTREPLSRLAGGLSTLEFPAPNAFDPIDNVSLKYEGTKRLDEMEIDFFSLVQPYYHGAAVPTITGYHVYSYSADFTDTAHLGSVDFGKLTTVTALLTLSTDCVAAMAGTAVTPFYDEKGAASILPPGYISLGLSASAFRNVTQSFEVVFCSVAHIPIRMIGGAAGFPIY